MNRFKRNFWMSTLTSGVMVLGAGPAFASPNGQSQMMNQQHGMGMQSQANEGVTSPGKLQASDAHALWLLHKINQGEIAQAQLAQSNSRSDKVKDLAGDLLDDHKGLDEKVLSLAKDNNVQFAGEAMGTGGAGMEGSQSQGATGTESTGGGTSTVEEIPNSGTGGSGAMGHAGMGHGQLSNSDQRMLSNSKAQLQKLQGLQGRSFDRAFLKGQVKDHQSALSALRGITAQNEDVKGLLQDAIPTLEKHEKESREALQSMRGVGGSGDESGMQNGDQEKTGEGNWMQQSPDAPEDGTSEGTGTATQSGTGGTPGSGGSGAGGGGGTP